MARATITVNIADHEAVKAIIAERDALQAIVNEVAAELRSTGWFDDPDCIGAYYVDGVPIVAAAIRSLFAAAKEADQ